MGKWAEIIVLSEELARLAKEMQTKEQKKKKKEILVERTFTKTIPKKEISERWFFLNYSGMGTLDELVIIFDRNDATLWLTVDNKIFLPGLTLEEIPTKLLYSKKIGLVEEEGTYVLSITNIKFSEKIIGYVIPREKTTILGGRITITEKIVKEYEEE